MNYQHCAQCGARVLSYSRYCPKHLMANWRYGSATGRRLLVDELEPYQKLIGQGLAKRYDSAPVKAALEVADELLRYRPTGSSKVYAKLQEHMHRLSDEGVRPFELLEVVCGVFALELMGLQRFGSVKEANFAAARQVLKMRSLGKNKSHTTELLTVFGEMLREQFAMFAFALAKDAMQSDLGKMKRKQVMAAGWNRPE